MAINWDLVFSEAHKFSHPPPPSLCIQNTRPNHESARNIFKEDEAEIMAAAKKHGFKMISDRKAKSVSFVKPKATTS